MEDVQNNSECGFIFQDASQMLLYLEGMLYNYR